MSPRTLIVFGSGPGLGSHTASAFARQGFNHIILLARNGARLQEDKAFVVQNNPGVRVDTLPLDLADLPSVSSALERIDELAGNTVEVVFFNAARARACEVFETTLEELEGDFSTMTLSLYHISSWFIPRVQTLAPTSSNPSSKPALLVTTNPLPSSPIPQLLSLSLTKAAQANLVQNLAQAFSGSGVKIGLIRVEGVVMPENRVLNSKTIAERIVGFWERGEGWEVRIQEDGEPDGEGEESVE
ncbi:NAD(P)-binding protein [Sporormia fimetaria CBS 119925]|uniref:NAD(P)-binding protein n=1 Tax=Sporormia fimetaria CBS 119925 TaxID=1340428 RepID=A0A6A6VDV3_9PLEO|nr:NAD(P)-binding protein [Sporormia fimetaria CBS 119925]